MGYSTEQINAAWRAVGADAAGLKWDDFLAALDKKYYSKCLSDVSNTAVSVIRLKVMDEEDDVDGEIDTVYTFGDEWRMARAPQDLVWVLRRYGKVLDRDPMRNDLLQRHGFAVAK